MKLSRNSGLYFLPALVAVILTGCGGVGGSSDSPTPSPRLPDVAGLPRITATVSGRTVQVRWETPAGIPSRNILEYHIFRDHEIIGTATTGNRLFVDGPPGSTAQTISYRQANGTSLVQTSAVAPALTAGERHEYHVTAIYQSVVTSVTGQSGPAVYHETNFATSALVQVP